MLKHQWIWVKLRMRTQKLFHLLKYVGWAWLLRKQLLGTWEGLEMKHHSFGCPNDGFLREHAFPR